MNLIPGVRIDPRLRIDPWIGFTPNVSSGLLKCTCSGTTAKLLRMMGLTVWIRHNRILFNSVLETFCKHLNYFKMFLMFSGLR